MILVFLSFLYTKLRGKHWPLSPPATKTVYQHKLEVKTSSYQLQLLQSIKSLFESSIFIGLALLFIMIIHKVKGTIKHENSSP